MHMFEGGSSPLQLGIFFGLTTLIAVLTYWKVHGKGAGRTSESGSTREVFLAGGASSGALLGALRGLVSVGITLLWSSIATSTALI